MTILQRTRRIALASLAATGIAASDLAAQDRAQVVEVVPGFLLYTTPAGNVAAAIGTAGVFLIGPVTAQSTVAIQADLAARTPIAIRYVVVTAQDPAQSQGDGGWGKLGAFVAIHETALGLLHGHAARLAALGAEMPRISFSEVLKFELGGHEMHAVRQPAGYSESDVLVHFENAGMVYLGESLPGDGYPMIDSAQSGTVDSLIATLNPWSGGRGRNRFVGARGPVMTGADVTAFRDMLVAVRDRVRAAKRAGQPVNDVIAAHPTGAYDARYGSGRVTPENFVRAVYRTVR